MCHMQTQMPVGVGLKIASYKVKSRRINLLQKSKEKL